MGKKDTKTVANQRPSNILLSYTSLFLYHELPLVLTRKPFSFRRNSTTMKGMPGSKYPDGTTKLFTYEIAHELGVDRTGAKELVLFRLRNFLVANQTKMPKYIADKLNKSQLKLAKNYDRTLKDTIITNQIRQGGGGGTAAGTTTTTTTDHRSGSVSGGAVGGQTTSTTVAAGDTATAVAAGGGGGITQNESPPRIWLPPQHQHGVAAASASVSGGGSISSTSSIAAGATNNIPTMIATPIATASPDRAAATTITMMAKQSSAQQQQQHRQQNQQQQQQQQQRVLTTPRSQPVAVVVPNPIQQHHQQQRQVDGIPLILLYNYYLALHKKVEPTADMFYCEICCPSPQYTSSQYYYYFSKGELESTLSMINTTSWIQKPPVPDDYALLPSPPLLLQTSLNKLRIDDKCNPSDLLRLFAMLLVDSKYSKQLLYDNKSTTTATAAGETTTATTTTDDTTNLQFWNGVCADFQSSTYKVPNIPVEDPVFLDPMTKSNYNISSYKTKWANFPTILANWYLTTRMLLNDAKRQFFATASNSKVDLQTLDGIKAFIETIQQPHLIQLVLLAWWRWKTDEVISEWFTVPSSSAPLPPSAVAETTTATGKPSVVAVSPSSPPLAPPVFTEKENNENDDFVVVPAVQKKQQQQQQHQSNTNLDSSSNRKVPAIAAAATKDDSKITNQQRKKSLTQKQHHHFDVSTGRNTAYHHHHHTSSSASLSSVHRTTVAAAAAATATITASEEVFHRFKRAKEYLEVSKNLINDKRQKRLQNLSYRMIDNVIENECTELGIPIEDLDNDAADEGSGADI